MAFDIQFPVGPIGGGSLLGSLMMGSGALYGLGHTLGAGQAITNYNNNMALNPYLLYGNMTGAVSEAQRNQYAGNAWNARNQQLPLDLALQRQNALNNWQRLVYQNTRNNQNFQNYEPDLYNSPYFRAITQYGNGLPTPYTPPIPSPLPGWESGGYYSPYFNGGMYNPFMGARQQYSNGNATY